MTRKHRISAGSIISRDGKILLVRHYTPGKHDFYVLPGGGVYENEDAMAAAVRETKEEAGLNTEVIRLAFVEDMHILGWRECKLWFFCKDLGGIPDATAKEATREHIVSANFYTREELENKMVFPLEIQTDRFWQQLEEGFPEVKYIGIRETGEFDKSPEADEL